MQRYLNCLKNWGNWWKCWQCNVDNVQYYTLNFWKPKQDKLPRPCPLSYSHNTFSFVYSLNQRSTPLNNQETTFGELPKLCPLGSLHKMNKLCSVRSFQALLQVWTRSYEPLRRSDSKREPCNEARSKSSKFLMLPQPGPLKLLLKLSSVLLVMSLVVIRKNSSGLDNHQRSSS